jgi:glycosyltransferase involved in cell wall biosynthesis
MKKILIVLPTDSLGGAENYLKMIAIHYKNDDVEVYSFKNNERGRWDDIGEFTNLNFISKIHEIVGMIQFFFIMLFRRKKYDYIFTSQVYANGMVGILKSLGILKSKYFIARESTSIFIRFKGKQLKFYKNIINLGYRKMDLLICQTEVMKQQFSEHFSKIEKRTKVIVVPNPIDLKVSKTLSSLKIDTILPDQYIVSAGRLIELKGYDLLIESFSKLKQEHPNLKLVILGEGELLEELQSQAETLNISDSVIFPGFVRNVYAYFKHAEMCVVSSRIEGFPNVLLQMMSQNTRVISTICAGGIENIKGIYTCETHSEMALTTAMKNSMNVDTSSNRAIFDKYLNSRSIESFLETLDASIKN